MYNIIYIIIQTRGHCFPAFNLLSGVKLTVLIKIIPFKSPILPIPFHRIIRSTAYPIRLSQKLPIGNTYERSVIRYINDRNWCTYVDSHINVQYS